MEDGLALVATLTAKKFTRLYQEIFLLTLPKMMRLVNLLAKKGKREHHMHPQDSASSRGSLHLGKRNSLCLGQDKCQARLLF